MDLLVSARSSHLSKAQAAEVLQEIHAHFPQVNFLPIYVQSYGDKDQKTSLRTLGKSDFFTREIDELVANGRCRIAIHSAKDLPEPLREGLVMVALTKGLDSSDSLVMRDGMTLETLPPNAVIATSSERREEAVQAMRKDLRFIDLRGTIEVRLQKLINGEADGVVIAEAALIRLKLTHLNRIKIPGETVPFQGMLAILAREGDKEMVDLFSCIDVRTKVC